MATDKGLEDVPEGEWRSLVFVPTPFYLVLSRSSIESLKVMFHRELLLRAEIAQLSPALYVPYDLRLVQIAPPGVSGAMHQYRKQNTTNGEVDQLSPRRCSRVESSTRICWRLIQGSRGGIEQMASRSILNECRYMF